MRRLWVLLLTLGVWGVCAGEASAAGVTRAEVIAFLESKGLSAVNVSDQAGNSVKTKSDGIVWRFYFPNCPNIGDRCPVIQFSNGWSIDANQVSLERVNAWNRTKLFMRAYLSSDTTGFFGEYEVIVPNEGKDEVLESNYDVWRRLLPEFKTYFFGDVAVIN
jgi:hypothetical protein